VLNSGVGEADALEAFTRHDRSWVRRRWRGRLRSIAHILVPYHAFQVAVSDRGRRQSGCFAVDAVSGSLDPLRLDEVLETTTLDAIHLRKCVPVSLTPDEAWPILADKLRRVIFQTGFFRLANPTVLTEGSPTILHQPYWVGFDADGPFVRVEIFDAVRRSFEGAKARTLVEHWLVKDGDSDGFTPRRAPSPSLPSTLRCSHESRADR
jgi:hypothetical protein